MPQNYRIADSTLVWYKDTGDHFLKLNLKIEIDGTAHENQVGCRDCQLIHVAALDPGNRTFLTLYSPTKGLMKFGTGDVQKLIKIGLYMDKIISKASNSNSRLKSKLKKVEHRLRRRIKNLRNELHHQVANYLLNEFDVIVLPIFNTLAMARRGRRKINSKTIRGLMTLAHGSFRNKLTDMARRRGKKVLNPSEAYTSKCCSTCGYLDGNLGGAEIFRWPQGETH